MKPKNKLVAILFLAAFLNSCSKDTWKTSSDNKTEGSTQIAGKEHKNITGNNLTESIDQYKEDKNAGKKLRIDEKCIGCWKCAMIDPEHFKINMMTFVPDVLSQKNISSEATNKAIDLCPVDSISVS